jgi:hypothetical protein
MNFPKPVSKSSMAAIDLANFSALLDDAKCLALVRQHRWLEGVRYPGCGSNRLVPGGGGPLPSGPGVS